MNQTLPQQISEQLLKHMQNNWQDIFGCCEKMQRAVLADILSYASGSAYAQEQGFAAVKSYEEYRFHTPLSEYNDYKSYIQKDMCSNEPQLTTNPTLYYLTTTGTTGQPKYFLESAVGAEAKQLAIDIWNLSVAMQVPRMRDPNVKMLVVVNCQENECAPNGLEIVRSSGKAAKVLYDRHPQMYIHPYEFLEAKMSNDDRDYLQALYAVKEKNFHMLFCNNLAHFGAVLDVIDNQAEKIIDDIRRGHFSVELSAEDRLFLEQKFGADKERADELKAVLDQDGRLTYEKIWPDFCFIGTWLAGSIGRMAQDVLRRLPEQVQCISENYGCSEAMLSVPMEFGAPYGVLASFGCFFEFLPLAGGDPVPAWQAADGEYYELIITTYSGLYRYNLHDIVKICGFLGDTPQIEFCAKANEICNLADKKLYAYQIAELIEQTEKQYHILLSFYQSFAKDGQLNLILQPYEDEFPGERFVNDLQKNARQRGIELADVYLMDKNYRMSLFQRQMTNGRSIQTIKLPSVVAEAPYEHIQKIYHFKKIL